MNQSETPARRKGLFVFLASCIAFFALACTTPQVQAQQPDEKKGAAAAPADAKAGDSGEPKQSNTLFWIIEISGLIGLFILILSIYFVATVVSLFIEFRPEVAMPPTLVTQADELLEKKDYAGVYNLLKGNNSFYAKVLTAGMAELPNGIKEAQEVADRHGETLTVEMEKKISMLAVLGTLGPMIGLLGTLKGMIASFGEIARSGQQTLSASKVAVGISEALVLTFEGVILSVPAIYFFAFFKNRLMAISSNTTLQADHFLRKFHTAYKNRGAARTAATPEAPKA